MKKIMALALIGLSMTACEYHDPYYNSYDNYVYRTWYDYYGDSCGSLRPSCTYVDAFSDAKAMWHNDPDYSSWATSVWAEVFDTDLGYYVYARGYWGRTNVFYDYYTGRAINSGAESDSRDVLEAVEAGEEVVVDRAAKKIADKYALSMDVSKRVALALNDWNKIAKTRERTDGDLNEFSQRIYGVSLEKVKAVVEKGDLDAGDELVAEAAKTWKTSPENMKRILIDFAQ